MADIYAEAVNLQLHQEAEKRAKQHVRDFSVALLMQAKLVAFQEKADMVLSNHVDNALDKISTVKRVRSKELLIIVGSAFFGAFVQGFISELPTLRVTLIVAYVLLGFAGMFMVFWAMNQS